MRYAETAAGHLQLIAESDDREMLQDIYDRCGHHDSDFLAELLEQTGWTPNGHLELVPPESIGALTEAPILTNEVRRNDEGDIIDVDKLWWFPNYMVTSLPERLVKDGTVMLMRAP